jgi:hypothetical protein
VNQDNQAQMGDELDYVALATDAEANAKSVESLHLAALWRELAETYRELAAYHRPRRGRKARGGQGAPGTAGGGGERAC